MKKIAITGPESVGKSILSNQLGQHFRGHVVKEYARSYVEGLTGVYTYSDVENIAKHQILEYNNAAFLDVQYVFFDTFLIITKVWFEYVYNRIPKWLDKEIVKHPMDLYLLCAPDLPWIADGVRENPNVRQELFNLYEKELNSYGFNYQIVSGEGTSRIECAIELINRI